jgi:Ca-activated chloride channel family protein
MKDKLETTLKNLQAPAPDPAARLRAKRAALAEFERVQAANQARIGRAGLLQVLWRWLRPSREQSHGSASMKWFSNRGLLAGAAGVCVLAIGVAIVLPNYQRYGGDVGGGRAPEVVDEPLAALRGAAEQEETAAAAQATPENAPVEAAQSGPAPVTPADDADSRRQIAAVPVAKPESPARLGVAPPAQAPTEPPAASGAARAEADAAAAAQRTREEEIVVTGLRGSLKMAQEVKREAAGAVDSITAEDIGAYPDSNLSESLQRVPGVQITDGVFSYQENRDQFQNFEVNPIQRVTPDNHTSTFSADVDTASYSFVRGQLNDGLLPQKDAVRAEEMINYFGYSWPAARSRSAPFKPTVVVSDSPWNLGRKLVHIGIKGYEIDRDQAPDANLVLLLDVSGSMNEPDKLPLAVRAMEMLLDSLKPTDTVAIVVYAGAAGTVLEPTPVREKNTILKALRSLRPGGSTAGAEGIARAYELAERSFRKGGVNRILLATDGDFNVGISSTEELKGFVERKREKGIYLSVLGFGQGNYRDELAQALAQNGNGVAAYIDSESEARKVLVEQASGSLFTIAKDVKLQVEFNPATVIEYRLVGYETRALRREDFNNDAIDAGDVGAGHTVTAIYEITPVGAEPSVDEPRYEGNRPKRDEKPAAGASRNEYGFLKIRYKLPSENKSRLISEPIPLRSGDVPASVARDVRFSTAVAGFAQLLRGGSYTGSLTFDDVIREAQAAGDGDRSGRRAEFIELVRKAKSAEKE